jgi:hypothetical protein
MFGVTQVLKSEASAEFVKAVQEVEDRADRSFQNLPLLAYPKNLACWGILSRIILQIEETIAASGYRSQTQHTVTYNLSRGGAQALDWMNSSGAPPSANRRDFVMTSGLMQSATSALWTGVGYDAFTSTFPLWHKGVLGAQLLPNDTIRFASEDQSSLRVRAYLQGLKPAPDRPGATDLGADLEALTQQKILNIIQNSKGDRFSFTYGPPTNVLRQLFERYYAATASQFRRDDSLILGSYTLGTFRKFFSALLAICSVHEHACALRAQLNQAFPVNSAVMVLRSDQWVKRLSKISGLSEDAVSAILADLTFGATKILDLYVHPFVSMSSKPELLGIIPHIPLKSGADENILRVCSILRPNLYDAITSAKENEMMQDLKSRAYSGFRIRGPRLLPDKTTDIDLIVEDTATSTVVIAELKWLRKTIRTVEQLQQRQLFLRGVQQITRVKQFLQNNSRFLVECGDLTQDLSQFANVYYFIIPRDFFVWVESSEISVIDYDPFARALANEQSLADGVAKLLTFDWLPSRGIEFEVKYESASVNGAVIETDVIFPKY